MFFSDRFRYNKKDVKSIHFFCSFIENNLNISGVQTTTTGLAFAVKIPEKYLCRVSSCGT